MHLSAVMKAWLARARRLDRRLRRPAAWTPLTVLLVTICLPVPARAEHPALRQICSRVVEKNIVDRSNGFIRPSPLYHDGQWLRDSFWATGGSNDSSLKKAAFDRFASQLQDGQAPTRLIPYSNRFVMNDDESTLLFVIWAYRDRQILGSAYDQALARAWTWVRSHVADGQYWSPPGNLRSWHDALVFPGWDVISYNQGLYVAAAHAAAALGLPVSEKELRDAEEGYRRLFRSDLQYLPVSRNLPYHDISALIGEALLRILFDRSALYDEQVIATVSRHPGSDVGFLVLSKPDGNYLPYDAFDPPLDYGDYQNGGSWFLYDFLALLLARNAGWSQADRYMDWRLNVELTRGSLHEYLMTQPIPVELRPDYAWNAYACSLADWR